MKKVLLGFSLSQGDPKLAFDKALGHFPSGVAIQKTSSIYKFLFTKETRETIHDLRVRERYGGFSMAVQIGLTLDKGSLAHQIENIAESKNADLLIKPLAVEDEVILLPHLTLPAPDFHIRPEFLIPAAEVWPDFLHPVLKQTLKALGKQFDSGPWGEFYAMYNFHRERVSPRI